MNVAKPCRHDEDHSLVPTGSSHQTSRSQKKIPLSQASVLRRSILSTAVGSFVEWYDFGIYGFLAPVLAEVFYPTNGSGAAAMIATFGTLSAAFAVRPIGGAILGFLGDRIGRKWVLIITVSLMALGTTITGILPNYDSIGIWAPILLIITRIMQGFSTGGEYVNAMTYISEHAPDRRRGFFGGFLPLGTLSGYVVGAGIVTALQTQLSVQDMLAWGWRIPFLIGIPFACLALTMRLRAQESPAYQQFHEQTTSSEGSSQLVYIITHYPRALITCIGLVFSSGITGYMFTGYLPSYFHKVGHISAGVGLAMIVIVLVILLCSTVWVGWLSDRIGRKPFLWIGCSLLVFMAIPAFTWIHAGTDYVVIFLGVLCIGLTSLCFDSIEPSNLPALFPTKYRSSGLAIAFNISISLFGGTTPLISESLIDRTGNIMMPAYVLMTAGIVGMITTAFTPELSTRHLREY